MALFAWTNNSCSASNEITDAEQHSILYLGPRDVIALQSTSKSAQVAMQADATLWRGLLKRDYGRDALATSESGALTVPRTDLCGIEPLLPPDATISGEHVHLHAYRRWHAQAAHVGGGMRTDHFLRSHRAWAGIRRWLARNELTDVERTLKPGLSSSDFRPLELALAAAAETARATDFASETLSAVKAVYAVCGGQLQGAELLDRRIYRSEGGRESGAPSDGERMLARTRSFFNGLFGGFSVYDHISCAYLTFEQLERNPSDGTYSAVDRDDGPSEHGTVVRVMQNHRCRRSVCVDVASGSLFALYEPGRGQPTLAHPLTHARRDMLRGCSVLGLIEEYCARLESGYYRAAPFIPDPAQGEGILTMTRGINIFPNTDPEPSPDADTRVPRVVSVAVTRGVEIRASVLCLNPEDYPFGGTDALRQGVGTPPQPQPAPAQPAAFAYSLRMRLTGAGTGDAPVSCQLLSRCLHFTDARGVTRVVEGPAVVGKLPLLRDGGYVDLGVEGAPATGMFHEGPFVYQSQTGPIEGTDLSLGSIRGSMKFVPGSIDEPTGPPFDAELAAIMYPALPDLFG